MNEKTKKLIILNLPYVVVALLMTNLGKAWRLASGAEFSEKFVSFLAALGSALSLVPSFHPFDLFVGILFGGAMWLAVYMKGKNAKKYRHGSEYGSARWSA